jgi:tellurite resistance protein TerC
MQALLWAGFILVILALLALDLGVLNRGQRVISARRALAFTGFFVSLALAFNVAVYFIYEHHLLGFGERVGADLGGRKAAIQFFTGWLMEYSLSLDNIFVIALIFRHLGVAREQQHRVLFWGIIGALVMRGVMIGAGAALLRHFEWMIYVFGAILLLTALRLLFAGNKEPQPEQSWILRAGRRWLPVVPAPASPGPPGGRALCPECALDRTGEDMTAPCPRCGRRAAAPLGYANDHFFVRIGGKLFVTPLFLVLLVVEFTDVIFAVDSIPAIFGVTREPFLVFSSNVFAILGLRSLYFALAAIIDKFRYLKTALVFVLIFIALKMLLPESVVHVPDEVSLITVAGMLALGVFASLLVSRRERMRRARPVDDISDAVEEAWRRSRKGIVLVVGMTLLITAILISPLPGPGGLPLAIGALALLATEFVWAAKLLKALKSRTRAVAVRAEGLLFKRPRPWLIPLVVVLAGAGLWALLHFEPFHRTQILLASIGPWLAIIFWAVITVKRYRTLVRRQRTGTQEPPPVGPA